MAFFILVDISHKYKFRAQAENNDKEDTQIGINIDFHTDIDSKQGLTFFTVHEHRGQYREDCDNTHESSSHVYSTTNLTLAYSGLKVFSAVSWCLNNALEGVNK